MNGGKAPGRDKRFAGAAQEMLDGSMRKDHLMGSDHPSGLTSGQGSPKAAGVSPQQQDGKTPTRGRRLAENAEMSNRMQLALAAQQQQQ